MIKRNIKYILPFLFFILFISACEKEITIDLPDAEEKVVIEGWIEQGDYPMVIITKNSPYFSVIDSQALADMIVMDAVVKVNDGTNEDSLTLQVNFNYFPPLVYKGNTLKGEIGKTYYLTVEVDGKTFTASTTIPQPVPYDSVWFQLAPTKDSLGFIWALFSDPPELGNYYRIFTKRVGKDRKFIPLFGSTYEDVYFNGMTLSFSMYRGVESLSDDAQLKKEGGEFGYFKIGDTIIVRSCAIDREHYDFWRTAEQEILSGGNPFSSPVTIATNIQGGGLGVWGGYGATYDTVIAK